MVELPRANSNLPCRPASPFSTVVRGRSVCLNRPKLTRTCPVGFIKVVRGGSVRSNRSELTRTSPEGLLPPTAQWIEDVRCSRTFPNSLKTALEACFPFHHSGSRRFDVVEPPRTHSFLPASPFVTVIQGGSVFLNLPELTRTFPVGLLPPSGRPSLLACFPLRRSHQ